MATRTDGIVDRVSDRLDDLRDTTAGALSADDAPSLRELGRVRRRLDEVQDEVTDQLSVLGSQQAELAAELRSGNKRTTFPRRVFWMLLGGAAAAVGTWLADPDKGEARRAQLADQAKTQARQLTDQAMTQGQQVAEDVGDQARAKARELGDQARSQAHQAANVTKGAVAEGVDDVTPDDVPDDPVVLTDRIKSQVLGHRDDVQDVVLTVGDPGHVTLKGTIPTAEAEASLVEAVTGVNGVTDVDSDLSTTS